MVNTGKLFLIVVHDMETFHETYHWKIIRRIEKKLSPVTRDLRSPGLRLLRTKWDHPPISD